MLLPKIFLESQVESVRKSDNGEFTVEFAYLRSEPKGEVVSLDTKLESEVSSPNTEHRSVIDTLRFEVRYFRTRLVWMLYGLHVVLTATVIAAIAFLL